MLLSIFPLLEKAIEGDRNSIQGDETDSGAVTCESGPNCAPPLYQFLFMTSVYSSHSQHKSTAPTSLI